VQATSEDDTNTAAADDQTREAAAAEGPAVSGPAPAPGKSSAATAAWLSGAAGMGLGMSGTAGGDALNLAGLLNVSEHSSKILALTHRMYVSYTWTVLLVATH
jgi:hypothetical protein